MAKDFGDNAGGRKGRRGRGKRNKRKNGKRRKRRRKSIINRKIMRYRIGKE